MEQTEAATRKARKPPRTEPAPDAITEPLAPFKVRTGLGGTKIYELDNKGEIDSFLVDGRRLFVVDSWRRYVERQLQAQKKRS